MRGGTRTRLVPDPAWTSYLIAGDDGSKREDEDEKAGGGPENLADVAVQMLLPDGYPHSVSSDYLNYSLWRGVPDQYFPHR